MSEHNQEHQGGDEAGQQRRATIVDRVNQLPIVNMAVNVSYNQYDKLKQSSVTVAEVMSRAEQWAYFMWGHTVQPIVTKLQEPLGMADQLACQTLDYVEEKVPSIKKSPSELINEGQSMKVKYVQVVEQSSIAKFVRMVADSFFKTLHQTSSQVSQMSCQTKQHVSQLASQAQQQVSSIVN